MLLLAGALLVLTLNAVQNPIRLNSVGFLPDQAKQASDGVPGPWPGFLVGGPHPKPADWFDDQEDYRTNEIAINWNAALVSALAWLVGDTP